MSFTAWVWWHLVLVAVAWPGATPAGAQETAESRAFKDAALVTIGEIFRMPLRTAHGVHAIVRAVD